MSADFITVLECEPGRRLAKRIAGDGTVEDYDGGWLYRPSRIELAGLADLGDLLEALSGDPTACVIRGALIPGAQSEWVPRRSKEQEDREAPDFEAAAHRWVCLDLDASTVALDPADPRASIAAWRATLPSSLATCGMVFVLSSKASLFPYLRGHAWVWATEPVDDTTLRAWCAANDFDPSLARAVQPHYTAAPIFVEGADPYAGRRVHRFEGPDAEIDWSVAPAPARTAPAPHSSGPSVAPDATVLEVLGDARDHQGHRWNLCGALGGVWRRLWRSEEWARATIEAWLSTVPGDHSAAVAWCRGAWRMPPEKCTGAAELALHLGGDEEWAKRVARASARPARTAAGSALVATDTLEPFHPVDGPLLSYYPAKGNAAPEPRKTISNIVSVLESHGEWAGRVSYDTFAERMQVLDAPWGYSGEWNDDQTTALCCWLSQHAGLDVACEMIERAVNLVARANAHNVLADWLGGLQWDGEDRIEYALTHLFGAEDSAYVRAVSSAWLVMLVQRAFEPGCQADYMLILEGPQGARKSSALQALVGRDWFSDTAINVGSKDALLAIRGKWVHEIGELASFNHVDAEVKKAFLTTRVDRYREPYARRESDHPRTCLFVGTTNEDMYLRDATGGRRYWPITVGDIDLEGIRREREQLFAEAVAAYRAGHTGYLAPVDEALAQVEQAARDEYSEDAWDAPLDAFLAAWVAGSTGASSGVAGMPGSCAQAARARDARGFRVSDVLLAIGLTADKQDRRAQARAKALLRRRGWRRAGEHHLYAKSV